MPPLLLAIKPSLLTPILVVGALLVLLGYVALLKKRIRDEREDFFQMINRMEKKADDDQDALFVQLLEWRRFVTEYRALLKRLVPSIEHSSFSGVADELETRFKHLEAISEMERKRYMAELRKKEDYTEEFNKVIDQLSKKLSGMDSGLKATEDPLLNDNRQS